jgi:hypothetical protein
VQQVLVVALLQVLEELLEVAEQHLLEVLEVSEQPVQDAQVEVAQMVPTDLQVALQEVRLLTAVAVAEDHSQTH